jgi:hypothetical protein
MQVFFSKMLVVVCLLGAVQAKRALVTQLVLSLVRAQALGVGQLVEDVVISILLVRTSK